MGRPGAGPNGAGSDGQSWNGQGSNGQGSAHGDSANQDSANQDTANQNSTAADKTAQDRTAQDGAPQDEGAEALDRWVAENEAKAQRFQQMRDGVQQVSTTETSRDGIVTVTVDAAGNMTDLQITDGVKQLSGSKVASQVLGTMRRAQSRLAEQVAEVVSATVGDDRSTMDTMLSSYRGKFPEPEDDEQDFGRRRDRGVQEIQLDDFEQE